MRTNHRTSARSSIRRTALQDPRRAPLRRAPLAPALPGRRFKSLEPVELVLEPEETGAPAVGPRRPPRMPSIPARKVNLRRLSTTQRQAGPRNDMLDKLEIFSWWDSETREFGEFVLKLLASLPGGDEAEDVGYEALPFMGWKEADLIGTMLNTIETKEDVEYIVHKLIRGEEEEGGEERDGSVSRRRKAARQRRASFDDFFSAYLGAALWSTNDESDPAGGEPLDQNYDIEDVAPETRQKMEQACRGFYEQYKHLFDQYPDTGNWGSDAQAGHDLWLSSNGHGVGFLDRNLPDETAKELDQAADKFGGFDLYVGDDGLIYA